MIVLDGVEMVDVREAAAMVRRTPEPVRRWIWTGRVPAVKYGNKLLLRRSDMLDRSGSGDRPFTSSLEQWALDARTNKRSARTGVTARDLVLDDRADRHTVHTDARR
jgi:hypothetical protein